jgi:hypothetical protein
VGINKHIITHPNSGQIVIQASVSKFYVSLLEATGRFSHDIRQHSKEAQLFERVTTFSFKLQETSTGKLHFTLACLPCKQSYEGVHYNLYHVKFMYTSFLLRLLQTVILHKPGPKTKRTMWAHNTLLPQHTIHYLKGRIGDCKAAENHKGLTLEELNMQQDSG